MQKQNSLTFHCFFPDQIQFFTDQNTAVLRPICFLTADKLQSPFTSSLKCTSLILQMKQIKSLNSFLAQNVLKLTSFHSVEQAKWAREKVNTFFTFQVVKIPATTHILGQNFEIPWLFWYLKFPWLICQIPWLFPDREEKSNYPDFSLTSGHPDGGFLLPWTPEF